MEAGGAGGGQRGSSVTDGLKAREEEPGVPAEGKEGRKESSESRPEGGRDEEVGGKPCPVRGSEGRHLGGHHDPSVCPSTRHVIHLSTPPFFLYPSLHPSIQQEGIKDLSSAQHRTRHWECRRKKDMIVTLQRIIIQWARE